MFKKISALLCLTLSIVLFCMAVSATETETESESTETVDIDAIYVSKDGTEDISAPVVATLSEAYSMLGNEGTIYLMDTVEVSATSGDCFIAPAHTGKITITSADGYDGALDMTAIKHVHFGGETEWNNIGIIANDVVLTADNNIVTMGEGLAVSSDSDDTYYRGGHTYCGARIHLAAYAPCETANVTCDTAAGKLYVHSGEYWSVSSWYGGAVTVEGGETQIFLGKKNEQDSIWVRYLCPGLYGVTMDELLTASNSTVVVTADAGLNTAEPYRFTQNNFSGSMTVNWLLRETMQGSATALVGQDFYPADDAECTLDIYTVPSNSAAKIAATLLMLNSDIEYLGEHSGDADIAAYEHEHEFYTHSNGQIICIICGFEQCRHLTSEQVITTPSTCTTYGVVSTYCTDICKELLSEDAANELDASNHTGNDIYYRYSQVYDFMAYRCKGCDHRFEVIYRDGVNNHIIIGEGGTDYTASLLPPTDGSPYYFETYEEALRYINVAANLFSGMTLEFRGDVEIPYAIDLPSTGGHVHITGSNDARLIFNCHTKRIRANDDTTVDNIKFAAIGTGDSQGIVVCGQNHKLVMGNGITVQNNSESICIGDKTINVVYTLLYAIGGFPGTNALGKTIDADITVRSGRYRYVGGWNFNAGTNHGSAKMTIGKTDSDDELNINILCPFSRGDGYIDGPAETTMIIDGNVEIGSLYLSTLNKMTYDRVYNIDVVLKGAINSSNEGVFDLRITGETHPIDGSTSVVRVYTDTRINEAVKNSYVFFGNESLGISRDKTLDEYYVSITPYTYEDYCASILGGHTDADEDGLCDECGHNMSETE